MWCEGCSQEVPGVARPGNRQLIVCPRCGQSLLTPPAVEVSSDEIVEIGSAGQSPPIFEDDALAPMLDSLWEQEAWVAAERDADRLLHSFGAKPSTPMQRQMRVDGAHSDRPPHLAWPAGVQAREDAAARAFGFAKVVVLLGAIGMLVGGGIAMFAGSLQQPIWRIAGLVAASVSQLLVFSGGLGLLVALWRLQQVTRERVARLDRELATLQQRAREVATTDDAAAHREVANGRGGDTLLLVDKLRRQLDRLAERVRSDRPAA